MGSAKTLLSIAPYLVGIIFDSFAERGMRLHSGQGKSAALFPFRGPGASHAKLALWKHADGILHISSSAYGQFQLHAVRQYTHLGTVLDEGSSILPELAHRYHSCAGSWKTPRKVLREPLLSTRIGVVLVDSLILSGRLYNSSTWPTLSTAQDASLDDDITHMYRAVLKQPRKDNTALHNSYIRAQVLKADISTFIRAHRLRLFGGLVNSGLTHLLGLLGVL
eukprot:7583796-Pyramimonas_sp.AAC.1